MLAKNYKFLIAELLDQIKNGHGNEMMRLPEEAPCERFREMMGLQNCSDEELEELVLLWEGERARTPLFLFHKLMQKTDMRYPDFFRFASSAAEHMKEESEEDESLPWDEDLPWDEEEAAEDEEEVEQEEEEEEQIEPESVLKDPRKIYELLSEHVFGQEEAKKQAALLAYNHMAGHRRVMLLAGPSGSGKTEIFRALSRVLPSGMVRIVDGSRLVAEGYKGSMHVVDIFKGSSMPKEGMIVVVDEADKGLFESQKNGAGTDYSALVQSEFLKLLDGDTVEFFEDKYKIIVDSSCVSWVLCGSFETLLKHKNETKTKAIGFGAEQEDYSYANTEITSEALLQHTNMRLEIASRIQMICVTDPMGEEEFLAILKHPEMSPVKKLEEEYGIRIRMDDASLRALARKAEESGLGFRYLQSQLRHLLDNAMFENPENECYVLTAADERHAEGRQATYTNYV